MKDFFVRKNNKIIFSIIGGTIILALIIYIIFSIFQKKNNDSNNDELVDNYGDIENVISKYDTWSDYLQDQKMDSIIIQNIENNLTTTIDEEQLDKLFSIISNNLIKVYDKDFKVNSNDSLIITYSRNNNNYKIEIIDGFVFGVQDKYLIVLFDNAISEIENEKYKDNKDYTFIYKIKNFDSLNLDSYLK